MGGGLILVRQKSVGTYLFTFFNLTVMALLALICLLPIWHVAAVSLSDKSAAAAGTVRLWPIGLHGMAYREIFKNQSFIRSFLISVFRVIIGTSLNMLLVILAAYPLSHGANELKGRGVLIWLFFFPMLFGGGLIPTYLLMRDLHLLGNIWSLVINGGLLPIFNVIILMNFFRELPSSLGESAKIDGADHFTVLLRIYIPLSMASLATLTLFSMVGYWNEWFQALIYLSDSTMYPLQTRLQQMVISIRIENLSKEELELLSRLDNRSFKAAQIIVSTVPILCVYPFLQKYFVTGITLGAVKG